MILRLDLRVETEMFFGHLKGEDVGFVLSRCNIFDRLASAAISNARPSKSDTFGIDGN